jgi:organic hydroperoxide reductase OsmC/OhrA
MADKRHRYLTKLSWRAPPGGGTTSYTAYARDHVVRIDGRPDLAMSSDPAFRGDSARHNPEDLLVASLSSCHLLWYLSLCARAGVVVIEYADAAEGTMVEDAAAGGRFERVALHPRVTIARGDPERAMALHHEAHRLCYIANSVNFPVDVDARVEVAST